MAENEIQIQIRTLTGESTTSLSLQFPFHTLPHSLTHFFFQGHKLRPHTQLATFPIQRTEFLVLVPFAKKEKEPPPPPQPVTAPASSSLADSTWSSIMDDLSHLRHATGSSGNASEAPTEKRLGPEKPIELPYHLILNTLRDDGGGDGALGDHNCEVFAKVLESVSCLSDLPLGHCKLLRRAPFLYLQRRRLTSILMEKAFNELAKFGVELGVGDIEHLSLLCPHVNSFILFSIFNKTSFGDVIVIVNCSTCIEDQSEENPKRVRKWMYVSKIVSTLKRRDSSFRKHVGWAFEQLPFEFGDEMTVGISMEELLAAVKGCDFVGKEDKSKRVKRSKTTSKPDLNHTGCHDTKSLLALDMIDHLKKGIGSEGQIVHIEDICARKAIYSEFPIELSEKMRSALKCIGVSKFYSHQAESIQASLHGKNVVVATMTSSGKSLCYNLPVLEVLFKDSSSCALYIFPTKALAQDQLRALLRMSKGFDIDFNIGIYDGDTSLSERTWLRDNSRLLITNPDMLHISILPHHRQFSRILSNLRFVVIDETHTYKGAFGCHTALILRRLKRLCSHVYGSVPSFVFSTATSANPREHSMELANLSTLELFQNDGSPSARKLFVLWNPALRPKAIIKKAQFAMSTDEIADESVNFVRSSPIVDVSRLFAEMVQHGLRCIAFCKSRKLCELVLSYTREILHETAPHLVDSICAYRGGYIAEERRKIESSFFGGKICGVAATNALELGIDVGEIDATLHLGFPGSIASLWQQAGRGGRRNRPSLAVYVAFGGPLDQYFMKHPKKLFERPIECCHVDSQNKQVLEQHLACAAHEHPLNVSYDEQYFGPCLESVIISLKARGYLSSALSSDSSKIWNYIGPEKLPSHVVNIRAIETVRYSVVDLKKNEVLEEIEESKAFFQVYEGAVYMCQGKTYLVEKLDLSNKTAFCKEADLKYYTKTRDYTDIHVIGGNIAYPIKVETNMFLKSNARADVCKVTTTWFGFYRIWRGSNQIFDTVDLALPQYSYESQAVWVPVPQPIKEAVTKQNYDFRGGLHAASHAILHVVPLHITCNLSDLAPECPNPHDSRYYPERILIYDQHPGGCGISVQVQPYFTKFLAAALELLTCCCCSAEVGCPNCVQSFACQEYNEVLHKDAAIVIIKVT
uniref:ATP-dependent helicase HRQ1 n=1 Tax=Cajanus cajan TaxID=3821 RepID=A0A151RZG9_CAJCA|nr:Putative ATP-dependent helicase HRQ1 [Cajanus cajan]